MRLKVIIPLAGSYLSAHYGRSFLTKSLARYQYGISISFNLKNLISTDEK
jgi:hypothetical protein